MGFFSFIENFFFLSLAITFVLILLLVYHFKQRITSLEQKNDTMFEIANGLVKEVGAMKGYILSTMSTQNNYPFNHISLHKINEMTKLDVVEEEEDGEEDDEEDDEEDEEDEDDEDDEDDKEDEDIDGDVDIIDEDDDVEEINDIVYDDTSVEELKIVEVSLNEIENEDLDIKENELKVNKIETDPVSVNDIQSDQTPKTEVDSYKKMNVHQLKAFIIEKGYTTDFKNLKRNDLIKIIEDNESK